MTSPLRDNDDALGQLLARAKQGGELPRPGAQERVWRKLQQPKRPSAAWLLIPVAAAAAAALVFFLAPRPAPAPEEAFATVTLAAGDVQASSGGATWSAAKAGQQLAEGAQLKVAGKSRAYTRLRGAGALFREGTRAALSKQQLVLEDGVMVAAARAPLRVTARAYTVDVQSAVFQLEVAAEVVTLNVSDGEAHVSGATTDVRVRAGESWSSAAGKGRAVIAPADLATARALAAATKGETVLRIAKPAGAQITIDGVELGTAPLEVVASAGAHELVGAKGSGRTTMKATLSGGGGVTLELAEPKPSPLPDVSFEPEESTPAPVDDARPQPKVVPPEDPGKRYLLARSLAQKGRVAEAISIYEGLARGDSGWAEPSRYEVARLELRALKRPAAAAKALDDYRARWPKGSLAHEVALSSIEVQLKLGAGEAALREMDDFLARFPSSERRGDVRFLRATVRRDRGDCAGAAADYLALDADAAHADDALYFAAVCEQQLGEDAAARRHLREYLERFPAGAHRDEVRRFFEGATR